MTAEVLRAQLELVESRAAEAGVELVADPYVFTDVVDGAEPWSPDAVSQYFDRMRKRVDLDHVKFHHLRKFMETYGQEAGLQRHPGGHAGRPRPEHRGQALQRPGGRDRPCPRCGGRRPPRPG